MSGLVARENSGKIQEKSGTGRDYSTPLGKVLNGLEMIVNLQTAHKLMSQHSPASWLSIGTGKAHSCTTLVEFRAGPKNVCSPLLEWSMRCLKLMDIRDRDSPLPLIYFTFITTFNQYLNDVHYEILIVFERQWHCYRKRLMSPCL